MSCSTFERFGRGAGVSHQSRSDHFVSRGDATR